MLKTRITEQYGLKVPFINAGMAFIATAPMVRAVCSAGGMGMLGGAAMPPDVLQSTASHSRLSTWVANTAGDDNGAMPPAATTGTESIASITAGSNENVAAPARL